MASAWPALMVSAIGAADAEPLHAVLAGFEIAAIEEVAEDTWRIFFPTGEVRDRAGAAVSGSFARFSVVAVDIDDDDWAARSQENLRAITIGKVIVAPPWDVPTVVTIRPSTGFGTGHHATTRLCLAALQRLDLTNRSVLDVGTGSGVLAIAASLLGAEPVTGIDDDQDAIAAAWDNLALNPGSQVSLLVGDLRSTELVSADVVLANLTGALLVGTAARLVRLTSANGRLILSGFQTAEERDVVSAFGALSVESRAEEEGWVCLTFA